MCARVCVYHGKRKEASILNYILEDFFFPHFDKKWNDIKKKRKYTIFPIGKLGLAYKKNSTKQRTSTMSRLLKLNVICWFGRKFLKNAT